MSQSTEAWTQVGQQFEALGLKLKLHLEQERADHDDDEKIANALERFGESLDDAFDALENAAKDDAVRSDVKGAAGSIRDALTTTFGDVTNELRSRLGR